MNIRHETPSGGNVFDDLGFGAETAKNLNIRSSLMIAIRQIVEERSLVNMLSHAGLDLELRLAKTA